MNSKPLYEHLFSEIDGTSKNSTTVTDLVRKSYFSHLKKIISKNLFICYPNSNIGNNIEEDVIQCAQEIELKVLKSCMQGNIYRNKMLKEMRKIKSRTVRNIPIIKKTISNVCDIKLTHVKMNELLPNDNVRKQAEHELLSHIKEEPDYSETGNIETKAINQNTELNFSNKIEPKQEIHQEAPENELTPSPHANDFIYSNNPIKLEQISIANNITISKLKNDAENSISFLESPASTISMKENVLIREETSQDTIENKLKLLFHGNETEQSQSPIQNSVVGNTIKTEKNDFAGVTSSWENEEYVQTALFTQNMNIMREINPERYNKVSAKINKTFGEQNISPSLPVDFDKLKEVCKSRITKHVISVLSKYYYKTRFIVSRYIFKVLSKKLVTKLLAIDPYMEGVTIEQAIKKLFDEKHIYIEKFKHVENAVMQKMNSKPLYEHLFSEIDGTSEKSSTVTDLVRKSYFSHLKKIISKNLFICYPNSNIGNNIEEDVIQCAQEIELKVLKSCLQSNIYRKKMLKEMRKIKSRTVRKIPIIKKTKSNVCDIKLTHVKMNELLPNDNVRKQAEHELLSKLEQISIANNITISKLKNDAENSISFLESPASTISMKENVLIREETSQDTIENKFKLIFHGNETEQSQSPIQNSVVGNTIKTEKNEQYVQTALSTQNMNIMREINPERYNKVCAKINKTFGEQNISPSLPVDFDKLKEVCKSKITKHVISVLSKYYYKTRFIVSRNIFKVLSKKLVTELLAIDPNMEGVTIEQAIKKLFDEQHIYIEKFKHVEKAVMLVSNYVCGK